MISYRRMALIFGLLCGVALTLYSSPERLVAVLSPTEGNTVRGTVIFTQAHEGVRVAGELQGLTPGSHAFHIHQYGDLTDPSGKSAGDHFNPENTLHGSPDSHEHHAGDIGNVFAGANGTAIIDTVLPFLNLNGDSSILGRAVVVHAGADDFESHASGGAGSRVAFGVIGYSNMD